VFYFISNFVVFAKLYYTEHLMVK